MRAAALPRAKPSLPRRPPSRTGRTCESTPARSASRRRTRTGFEGNARQVDLRKLPPAIPVPHVDSLLAFDYDVVGRFSSAYIAGGATFADSQFLGARVLTGAYGSIDTSAAPLHYTGEGPIAGIDLQRFARELDIGWLGDPRYAGTVAGRFYVDGWGADPATMALSGGGRLSRADLFGGRLTDADVSIEIAGGSLTGFYDGALDSVNPAIAFQDDTFSATLKGSGKARVSVPELLVRDVDLSDYSVESTLALEDSTVRGIVFDTLTGSATLDERHADAHRRGRVGRYTQRRRVGHHRVHRRPTDRALVRPHPRRPRSFAQRHRPGRVRAGCRERNRFGHR